MRFLIFLIFLVLKANALGIFIEGQDIVAEAEDLCAFEIEIAFDPGSSVQNLSIEKPFNGDFNVDREAGIIKIVGFSAEPLNGRTILARIEYDGDLKFKSAKLYDSEGGEIFSIGALTPERTPVYTSTPVRTPTTPKEVPTEIPFTTPTAVQTTTIPSININETPSITPSQNHSPLVETPVTTSTQTPLPTLKPQSKPTPSFEVIFAITGLLAVAYLLRRKN
ncbi:MAG: PGF-CTERM sorting domain-containing protein [Archaeoglobaceae archaeon]